MAKVVFDIETVGEDFDELDETSQEYFLKFAESEEEVQEAKNSLSFYPLTAEIVAIGMLDTDEDQGVCFYQNNNGPKEKFEEGSIRYVSGDERFILTQFWERLDQYHQFVTFNGRVFDCPFILLRSAIHGIRARKNLVPYRYNFNLHIDLADQLSFYDAMRRKFSLHMWCRAFGIKSPKEEGITGLQVKDLYKEARYQDIARYCVRDIISTKKLYFYWDKYLKFN